MIKEQNPNNKFSHDSIEHVHLHNDKHNYEILHAHSDEVPAVFSYSAIIQLGKVLEEDEFCSSVKHWMENLRDWSLKNKYVIGHLKAFVEIDEDNSIWIACTGKEINIKASGSKNNKINNFKINMTLIIFGPNEKDMHDNAIKFLKENLPFLLIK